DVTVRVDSMLAPVARVENAPTTRAGDVEIDLRGKLHTVRLQIVGEFGGALDRAPDWVQLFLHGDGLVPRPDLRMRPDLLMHEGTVTLTLPVTPCALAVRGPCKRVAFLSDVRGDQRIVLASLIRVKLGLPTSRLPDPPFELWVE